MSPVGARVALQGVQAVRGRRTVLHGVTFALEPGQCLRVHGGAGAGKSSLLSLISGGMPSSTGLAALPDPSSVALVSAVPALPRRGVPRALLAERLAAHGVARSSHLPLATRALEACGLYELRDEPIEQLSGSRRIALCLALSLAPPPDLLLLDDCLAPLDAQVRTRLVELLVELRSAQRMAVVHATSSADVEDAADVALVLEAGRQLAFGRLEDLTRPGVADEVVVEALDPRAAGLTLSGLFDIEAIEEPGKLTLRCRDGVEVAGRILRRPPEGLRVVTVRRRTLGDVAAEWRASMAGAGT